MATPIEYVRGLFSRLGGRNPYYTEPRKTITSNYYDTFLQWLGLWGQTSFDPRRVDFVRDGFLGNGDVYAVITQIAEKSSTVPFSVKRLSDPNKRQYLMQMQKSLIRGNVNDLIRLKMLGAQAYEPNPLPLPMDVPNPHQTWAEFFSLASIFYNVTGEAYFYWTSPKGGPNKDRPAQLFVLPSHLVQIRTKPVTKKLVLGESPVAFYQITYQEWSYTFEPERVIHVTMPNPEFNFEGRHLYGLSPLKPIWPEIMAGNEGNKNNLRMQKSGGAIGFVHGKNEILEEEQAKELKDRMVEMRNDPEALAQIAGISMEIGFTRVALDAKAVGMYENQTYVQKKVCNALGWSDKLLNNDEGAKYDNMIQAYKTVITNKLMPDLNVFAQALTRELLPKYGSVYKNAEWVFHFEQLPELQEDIKSQVDWILPLIREGVITRKEARNIMNFEEDPNPLLDMYTTNVNTLPLETAVNPNLDGIINEPEEEEEEQQEVEQD